jgi:hypothetical protein
MVRAQLINILIERNFSNNDEINEVNHKLNKEKNGIKIVMMNDTGRFLVHFLTLFY